MFGTRRIQAGFSLTACRSVAGATKTEITSLDFRPTVARAKKPPRSSDILFWET